jgi:exodeoxyribonuclease V gamma subunit
MLNIQFSNRIETLRDQWVSAMAVPLPDPLQPEYVLIDNAVMGQWLNAQLAQQQRIAANIRYIQPHELFWLLARAVVSADLPKETPLSKQEMLWKLYADLDDADLLQQPAMQLVKHYLAGDDNHDLKRYQLAASVADLFDQYLIYRPQWMQCWAQGQCVRSGDANECWQQLLWQRLAQGQQHRAVIEKDLLTALDVNDTAQITLPMQRLFVFGITTMPPHFVEMLMLLGKHISIEMFAINPSREYWFDIRSEKALAKQSRKKLLTNDVIGNPLLASQGQQVREFIESIYARYDQYVFNEQALFCDVGSASLLHSIQQEILDLQYCGEEARRDVLEKSHNKQVVPADELTKKINSIHVHSCHSALREVEVLHDQLLAMFSHDPSLNPRDVVVMMPQVAPYVPYIETIFGATAEQLPYHITDRSWQEEVPLLNVVDSLLSLPSSRFPLSDILAMLEVPAVQTKFGLNREGFERLKPWLRDAGVRWGIDAAHRESLQLPAYSEFSWEFAINRLMAGYAMQGKGETAIVDFGDEHLSVAPYDDIEGGAADVLCSFLQYWQKLLQYRSALAEPSTLNEWSERLSQLLEDFIEPQTDEEKLAMREVRKQISLLRKANRWFTASVPLSVVCAALQPALRSTAYTGHPWREGIKFCCLLPMRGVPFRVVYLLGMNQSDYPKRSTQVSFDLMRADYQVGDRSRRVDERWLFLEALLSARDAFHISYIGRDQRKNEVRQPSVVVSELLDYLRYGYVLPNSTPKVSEEKALMQWLVTEHPLQPFNPIYFSKNHDNRYVSFNRQAFAIASHKLMPNKAPVNYTWHSSEKSESSIEVSLESFVRFFSSPAQWYFRDRHAGVNLKVAADDISDVDLFALENGLDNWLAKNTLIQLADSSPELKDSAEYSVEQRVAAMVATLERQWKAEGRWPLGVGGDSLRASLLETVDVAWLDARHHLKGETTSHSGSCEFKTSRGKLILHGSLLCVGETYLFHTASSEQEKYLWQFAIQSAFAGVALSDRIKNTLIVFWKNKRKDIDQLDKKSSKVFLAILAELYMQYRDGGLPFAVEASLKYKPTYDDDNDSWEKVVQAAWYGSDYTAGIAGDTHNLSYYIGIERLQDKAFLTVAQTIAAAWQTWKEEAAV